MTLNLEMSHIRCQISVIYFLIMFCCCSANSDFTYQCLSLNNNSPHILHVVVEYRFFSPTGTITAEASEATMRIGDTHVFNANYKKNPFIIPIYTVRVRMQDMRVLEYSPNMKGRWECLRQRVDIVDDKLIVDELNSGHSCYDDEGKNCVVIENDYDDRIQVNAYYVVLPDRGIMEEETSLILLNSKDWTCFPRETILQTKRKAGILNRVRIVYPAYGTEVLRIQVKTNGTCMHKVIYRIGDEFGSKSGKKFISGSSVILGELCVILSLLICLFPFY